MYARASLLVHVVLSRSHGDVHQRPQQQPEVRADDRGDDAIRPHCGTSSVLLGGAGDGV